MADDILDFGVDEEPLPDKFNSDVLSAKNLSVFRQCDMGGAFRIICFQVEADKDYKKGTTFALCKLPQGVIRVIGAQSRINCDLSCKSAKIGWAKFRNRHQQIIEEDFKGFGEVKTKAAQSFLSHLPTQMLKLDSLEGVFVIVTTDQAGKKGDKIDGYFVYIKT